MEWPKKESHRLKVPNICRIRKGMKCIGAEQYIELYEI